MSKQDEAFETWWEDGISTATSLDVDDENAARIGFAAGREAERERILAAIEATRANYDDESICDEITRRIKEQEKS